MEFSIKGIQIKITFLFTAVIAFMLSFKVPQNVILTVIFSVVHEMGHLFVMVLLGNKPKSVCLEITGMNIKRIENTNISIKHEIFIALGGPFFNFVFFVLFYTLFVLSNKTLHADIACINLILMIFNMLPIKRLDGGMALYFFFLQYHNENICNMVLNVISIIFILLVYLWGIYVFVISGYNFSVIIIAIFLSLSMLGSNEY